MQETGKTKTKQEIYPVGKTVGKQAFPNIASECKLVQPCCEFGTKKITHPFTFGLRSPTSWKLP